MFLSFLNPPPTNKPVPPSEWDLELAGRVVTWYTGDKYMSERLKFEGKIAAEREATRDKGRKAFNRFLAASLISNIPEEFSEAFGNVIADVFAEDELKPRDFIDDTGKVYNEYGNRLFEEGFLISGEEASYAIGYCRAIALVKQWDRLDQRIFGIGQNNTPSVRDQEHVFDKRKSAEETCGSVVEIEGDAERNTKSPYKKVMHTVKRFGFRSKELSSKDLARVRGSVETYFADPQHVALIQELATRDEGEV